MNAKKIHQSGTGSAYFIVENKEIPRSHVLAIIVDNEPGVLARGYATSAGSNQEAVGTYGARTPCS